MESSLRVNSKTLLRVFLSQKGEISNTHIECIEQFWKFQN